jgi:RNA polymerase sigma factor (sigma-70 family)
VVRSVAIARGACDGSIDAVDDDLQLLHAWRGGDRVAGQSLLQRHFDPIARFFRSKLGDDVQDLVQRTFLDCVESRDRMGHVSVRAYLFAIARHRLVDHLRGRHLREVDPAITSMADLVTSASSRLARDDRQRLLALALQQLPLEQQCVLELAYWEGLSGPEIADALGVPATTIRSRITRARDRLRELLATLEGDPAALATLRGELDRRSREFDHAG